MRKFGEIPYREENTKKNVHVHVYPVRYHVLYVLDFLSGFCCAGCPRALFNNQFLFNTCRIWCHVKQYLIQCK